MTFRNKHQKSNPYYFVKVVVMLHDEIHDIRSGSRILRIGEDLIYVANMAAH